MEFNLHNTALPEEEAKSLSVHVKMCSLRYAQTLDEIRKNSQEVKSILANYHEEQKQYVEEFKVSSNSRQTRNERVAVAAFLVIAASLWPQLVAVMGPIISAFTGFAVPVARALTGI